LFATDLIFDRSPEDLPLTIGLTELQVKHTPAFGNLLPRIRQLYRDQKMAPYPSK